MLDLSNKHKLYNIFPKRKNSGKIRWIYESLEPLYSKQVKLKEKLEQIYCPPDCVYGYIKGRSPGDLASNHIGKDWVITIDIKDFFPSITKQHILNLGISEYEAEIATYNNKCVQGSPCSPIISNMIFEPLDIYIDSYCFMLNIKYNRYSDDLIFSGNGKPSWKFITDIKNKLLSNGFRINESKVKFMFKNQCQKVLGIIVNDKVSISRKVRSQLKFRASRDILTEQDKGMISYINSCNKEQYNKIQNSKKEK